MVASRCSCCRPRLLGLSGGSARPRHTSALGQRDTATGLRVVELEAKVTEYRHRAEVAEQLESRLSTDR